MFNVHLIPLLSPKSVKKQNVLVVAAATATAVATLGASQEIVSVPAAAVAEQTAAEDSEEYLVIVVAAQINAFPQKLPPPRVGASNAAEAAPKAAQVATATAVLQNASAIPILQCIKVTTVGKAVFDKSRATVIPVTATPAKAGPLTLLPPLAAAATAVVGAESSEKVF
ncbi:hypothetical protein H4R24_005437 [Coemansia sp. RSA 988]|nr:hypothetical protein H4R24_005437 [Coemansia sp. RSA 988]